jgi:predicted PurR-regulated permease PerM/nucleotide-binding universal stress UspA family protein
MQLTTPVLLIRAWHSAMTCRRFTGGLRIIVPLDGSALAEAALPCAQATAAVFHGELILVHIVSRLPPWSDVPAANAGHSSASDRAQLQAATYLHTIAKRLDGDQVRVRVVVGVGDVADTIASLARDHDAALVVMATHGRTGNLRTSLGTVARSVLWHCDSPVVLLRPAALNFLRRSPLPSSLETRHKPPRTGTSGSRHGTDERGASMESRAATMSADDPTPSSLPPGGEPARTASAIARGDWRRLGDFVRGIRPRDLLRWALVAGAAWGLGQLLWRARDALLPFEVGAVLAYLLLPLVNRLGRWLPRPLATLVVFLGGLLAFALALTAVLPPLADQLLRLTTATPDVAALGREVARLQGVYRQLPAPQQQFIADALGGVVGAARDNLVGSLRTVGTFLVGGVFNLLNVFSFLLGFFILPFWLFYVLTDQPTGRRALDRLLPSGLRADFWAAIGIVDTVLGRYIRSQLFLALSIAALAFVGLTGLQIAGVPGIQYTVVLAVFAGIAELIPLVGPIISAIPAILVGLAHSWQTALIVAALYFGIQQLENNLLAPRVIGASIAIHPALLMVALIVASHFGFLWDEDPDAAAVAHARSIT